jgi:hypothetical protein
LEGDEMKVKKTIDKHTYQVDFEWQHNPGSIFYTVGCWTIVAQNAREARQTVIASLKADNLDGEGRLRMTVKKNG